MQKLRQASDEVIEYIADKMVRFRRQTDNLGICPNPVCLDKYRTASHKSQYEETPMLELRANPASSKCFKCGTICPGQQDGYFCMFCSENYCDSCSGYNLVYDLQELEDLLK